jgi:hypothetical protein
MGIGHFKVFQMRVTTMPKQQQFFQRVLCAIAMVAAISVGSAGAQAHANAPAAAATPGDAAATQEKVLTLLRVSPTLSAVVANDPTLLSNQDYVSHNNPELAQFLEEHPEVGRNPGFYLFSDLTKPGQRRDYELLRPKWGFGPTPDSRREMDVFIDQVVPVLALVVCAVACIWVIRLISDSRRWKSTFKLQSEVHGRLIDKFGTNQELLAYMETDAGRRFLEAAPIATDIDRRQVPNVVSRMLTTLQAGVVMMLLGAGLLLVRNSVPGGETTMLIFGIIILMPGIGFTISAGATWALAKRLGLMPEGRVEAAGLVERQ